MVTVGTFRVRPRRQIILCMHARYTLYGTRLTHETPHLYTLSSVFIPMFARKKYYDSYCFIYNYSYCCFISMLFCYANGDAYNSVQRLGQNTRKKKKYRKRENVKKSAFFCLLFLLVFRIPSLPALHKGRYCGSRESGDRSGEGINDTKIRWQFSFRPHGVHDPKTTRNYSSRKRDRAAFVDTNESMPGTDSPLRDNGIKEKTFNFPTPPPPSWAAKLLPLMDENTNDICFFPTLPLRHSGTPRNFVSLIYDGHTRQRKISNNFTRLPPHTRKRNDVFRPPILTDGDVCPCRQRSWLNGSICRLTGTFRQICLSPRRSTGGGNRPALIPREKSKAIQIITVIRFSVGDNTFPVTRFSSNQITINPTIMSFFEYIGRCSRTHSKRTRRIRGQNDSKRIYVKYLYV